MAIDLSQLPDKSGDIDLSGLPDKPEKVNLSGLPDKGGFSPSSKIINTALKAVNVLKEHPAVAGLVAPVASAMMVPGQVSKLAGDAMGAAGGAASAVADSPAAQGVLSKAEKDPLASSYVEEGKTALSAAKMGIKAYSSALEGIQNKTTDMAIQKGIDPYIAHFAGMAASSVADLAAQAALMGGMGVMEESMTARNLVKDNILQLDEVQAQNVASLSNDSDPIAKQRAIEDARREEERQAALERQNTPSDQLKEPGRLGSTFDTRYVQRDPIEKTTITRSGPLKPSEPESTNDKIILGTHQGGMVPGDADMTPPRSLYSGKDSPTADFGRKIELSASKERPASIPISVPEGYTEESWSKSYYKPKDAPKLEKPAGVFGEPLTPENSIQTASGSIETVSRETMGGEVPATYDWHEDAEPRVLGKAVDRAIKEGADLGTRLELEAPSSDTKGGLKEVWNRSVGFKQVSRLDIDHMVDSYSDFIPDRSRRSLITMYSQLGRAPTLEEVNKLRLAYAGKTSKEAKAMSDVLNDLMGHDLTLNTQERGALKTTENYFEGMGQNAQKVGVLGDLRETYGGPHLYMSAEEANQGAFKKLISGRSKFAVPRTFDNAFQAAEAGFLPRTLDAAELMGVYHGGISKSIGDKYLIKALEKRGLINYTGEGQQIKGIQPEGLTLKNGTRYTKSVFSEDPEVRRLVEHTTEDMGSLVPYTRGIEKFYAYKKAAQLWGTVFHPFALAVEAGAKGFSPTSFSKGIDLIEKNSELTRSMIRSGLTYDHVSDWGKQLVEMAGKDKKAFNPAAFLRKMTDIQNDVVFRKYAMGLKVYHANMLTERLVGMGIQPERAMQLAVTDANIAFGGLNLEQAARAANVQKAFKLLAYSPDWTESKIRQLGGVAGKGYEDFVGELTPQEKTLMTRQSRSAMVKLVSMALVTSAAQELNPAKKFIDIDTTDESGFKDYKKLFGVLSGNMSYFSSKKSNLVRDFITMLDTKTSTTEKLKKVFGSSFVPFSGIVKFFKHQDPQQ